MVSLEKAMVIHTSDIYQRVRIDNPPAVLGIPSTVIGFPLEILNQLTLFVHCDKRGKHMT